MKNETLSRLILVLEIVAIILFHSFKSNTPSVSEITRDARDPIPSVHQMSEPYQVSNPLVMQFGK